MKRMVSIMKRFVKEYALFKIEQLKFNPLMQKKNVSEKVEKIKKALTLYEREMLTTEEAMKIIAEM